MARMEARPIVYCATGNPGKIREFRDAAAVPGRHTVQIEMLPGILNMDPPEETGFTFAENAAIKSIYYSRDRDGLVFADDSGLCVEALGGAPGVWSARYAGVGATDRQNIRLLLTRMANLQDRRAHFLCAIALAFRGKVVTTLEGRVDGTVLHEPDGSKGFGYDPIFFCSETGKSFAHMEADEKLAVSHRGKALSQLLDFLDTANIG